MEIVDCIIDLGQFKWVKILKGMEVHLCTIPAGATILSAGTEADGKYHIRYSIDNGEPCNLSVSVKDNRKAIG